MKGWEARVAGKDIEGAIDQTAATLKQGVVRLGVEAALPEISAWEERLAASRDPDLKAVAGTLGELKAQLDPSGLDPVSVGALLMSLGEQVGGKLSQLGALLGREGNAQTDRMTRV
ncbi:MAG: hypothetical protein H0U91_04590 [Rubrobacter sp.]|nr:hypothetical protein [Rubrobacter sp.]